VVVFWGRNKAEGSLRKTCDRGYYTTIIISFSVFGHGKYWTDLSGHQLHGVGADIKHCQSKGCQRNNRQNQDDQPKNTDHDTQIFTWKILQNYGKNHGHQPVTISLFLECLQERHAAAAAYKMIIDQSETLITVL
jgi:hypothetical protein